MNKINYFLSTNIHISKGELNHIKNHIDEFNSSSTVLIIDSNLFNNDYLKKIIDDLKSKNSKITTYVNNLNEEPTYRYLEHVRDDLKQYDPDLIVAIGGGSTLDIGKGIALLLRNYLPALELKGFPKEVNDPLPLITIPSVFGSGSEVSFNAVFIDEDEGKKLGINSTKNFPKKTIIDPLLTMSAPENVIISSAMDTLVHCVDSFGSKNSNPFSKMFSINGFNKTFNCLANEDLSDPDKRINLAIGSICGIIALMNSGDGPTNGFAYYFGVKNKIPHGIAGGMFLKDVMLWNYNNGYTGYSKLLIPKRDEKYLFEKIQKLYEKYDIPKLVDFGYKEKHIDKLAIEVSSSLKGSFSGNPIKFDTNSAKEILQKQIL